VDVRWWPIDGLPPDNRHDLQPLVETARLALGLT